jgi:hypothetical protein
MPVINGVYLKDFTALPSLVTDAYIIPIAITGNQIAYRTTVGGIVTDARVTSKLLTGLSITGSAIVATDTILQAFGKVQNQVNDRVPYTGATANVNLGTFDITTDIVNLNQLKAVGSGGLNIYSNSGTHIALLGGGGGAGTTFYGGIIGTSASFSSTVTSTGFIKSGGTSAQFLKADGTVDSTAYGTGSVTSVAALTLGTTGTDLSSTVANGTTTPVITLNVPTASASNRGALSAADWTTFNGKAASNATFTLGSTSIALGSTTTTIAGLSSVTSTSFVGSLTGSASLLNGYASDATEVSNTIPRRDANADIVARTYFMNTVYGDFAPNKLVGTSATGQIREMSQAQALTYLNISGTYLPLAGGTLTGSLSGTSATFTGTTASGVVKGIATSGFGVSGEATSGNAVTGNATTGVGGIFIANNTGGVGLIADSYTGVIAKFQASGSDKVTIANTGLLTGTSATFNGAVTINDAAKIKAGNGNQLILDNAGERFTQMDYYNNGSGKAVTYWDNTNNWFQIITTPASSKVRIVAQTNGVELANGGTSWSSLSDIREKTIIRPIQDALTTLKDYRTVIGRYNTDSTSVERAFLIAQDVQMTYPYAVTEDDDEDKRLRLSYTELIPLMIKAIQELNTRITILENN